MDESKRMPATDLPSVHAAKDIFNLDATPDQFFSGSPSTAVFFGFANHLLKRPLNRFCFGSCPYDLLRFFLLHLFKNQMFGFSCTADGFHDAHLMYTLNPIIYTRKGLVHENAVRLRGSS